MTADSRNAVMIVVRVMVMVGARFETTRTTHARSHRRRRCAATTYVIGNGQATAVSGTKDREIARAAAF